MGLKKKLRSIEYQQQQLDKLIAEDIRRWLGKADQKKTDEVKNEKEVSKDSPKV